ncbi:NADH-quinone oxidoreductase subunit J [Vulgatibacter incomptus]|uniref:NADH-quinone oxidoreductase subunit J n=1 Tax=Vulgatibacter incomptus TaxID=1391653 RepID=A0A0K1P988_9BACT|nr:NADH-quinone oxidoreductase subunit J [Vulgatibacter incomptus]AKU89669.1 NADH-ubiquinone oxidoreductase chain J [Vulgatibacter incomptus]
MTPTLGVLVSESLLFYPLAFVAVAGALSMILARSPVYAAMSLVLTFFGLAGLYVLLSAELIAALQIIVYAGAIMVLFLFVVMLLNLGEAELEVPRLTLGAAVGGGVALLFWCFSYVVFEGFGAPLPAVLPEGFGQVAEVGKLLYTSFILPFEATSVLLLVAIVGAVVVAKAKI